MAEPLRICRVAVRGLFGVFDHDLPLDVDGRITVVSAPNGFGKTIILKMLADLLEGEPTELRSVVFDSLTVQFVGGSNIRVKRLVEDTSSQIYVSGTIDGIDYQSVVAVQVMDGETLRRFRSRIGPEWSPGPNDTWIDSTDGERIGTFQLMSRLGPEWSKRTTDLAELLQQIRTRCSILFVRTQRLLSQYNEEGESRPVTAWRRLGTFTGRAAPTVAVEALSQHLKKTFRDLSERYTAVASDLDRSFPRRLLEEDQALAPEDVERRLAALEAKRGKLVSLGFLDQFEDELSGMSAVSQPTRVNLGVLAVYLDDSEKKLAVFDAMAERVSLLLEILNARYLYKQVSVSREAGFIIHSTHTKAEVPISGLSAGEQHELVLLYELLFKAVGTSLVLIDEPELSLHIKWQREFLSDLRRVVIASPVDILIATHSPQIMRGVEPIILRAPSE